MRRRGRNAGTKKYMVKKYILENGLVKEVSFEEWANWIDSGQHVISYYEDGLGHRVSTIMLGIEGSMFETQTIGPEEQGEPRYIRSQSVENAVGVHKYMKLRVVFMESRKAIPTPPDIERNSQRKKL